MNTKILEEVGLTGNEIKVYLALLELGSVTAGDILKKIELHRAAVYDTLDRLIDKGLVSYVIKANRKYFEAANAKNFLDVLEKKENKLSEEKKELKYLIPELEKKRVLGKSPQEVTLYKGNKSLKSIFQDWLECKEDIFVLGAYAESAESLKYHMQFSLPGFHNQRVKQKQMMKFIFPQQSITRAKQLKEYDCTSVKILPAPFASMTSIQIYGDKVATIMWSSEPIGIVVRSKEIAKSYKDYFDLLWKMAKNIN